MPQPAGQKLGTPFGQGEVKLKRFPLFLGVIGWILVICSFLFPYMIIQDAIKSGHPEGAGWVWIRVAQSRSRRHSARSMCGRSF